MQKKFIKKHTSTLVPLLEMIIYLSIDDKHNSLAKFCKGHIEIRRERRDEGKGICMYFCA